MNRMRLLLPIVVLVLATGCSYSKYTPSSSASSAVYQEQTTLRGSLFPGDQEVLSNEAIDAILNGKVRLPAQSRIAILAFSDPTDHRYWSKELTQLNRDTARPLLDKLEACERITTASVLPSLLTPERQNVPYLREAAARFQADLLLVYASTSQSFEKERLLAPDKVKAECRVEAVLLDVRTGIVPFTDCVVKSCEAKKESGDMNFCETIFRAQLKAFAEALEQVGADTAGFLQNVPSSH